MKDGMIARGNWDTFLTLEGEKLLLVKRKHLFVVVAPILLTSLLTFFLIFGSLFLFSYVFSSIPLFIATSLLLISIAISFVTKSIIDWYFHLYILTTRKIVEIWYTPLAGHMVNDVLLDKVNCTEIDIRMRGFFNELIDMGDVAITFDRPTHQQEFILGDIYGCHNVGGFLTQTLMDHNARTNLQQTIWFKDHSPAVASGY